jgi:hypothetical protein
VTTPLDKFGTVALDASGNGSVSLGPDASRGPATWTVDTVIWVTSRPGKAPIPRIVVATNTGDLKCVSYDGSFGQGTGSAVLTRGQSLVATWTGGQAGDTATFTVSGTAGN